MHIINYLGSTLVSRIPLRPTHFPIGLYHMNLNFFNNFYFLIVKQYQSPGIKWSVSWYFHQAGCYDQSMGCEHTAKLRSDAMKGFWLCQTPETWGAQYFDTIWLLPRENFTQRIDEKIDCVCTTAVIFNAWKHIYTRMFPYLLKCNGPNYLQSIELYIGRLVMMIDGDYDDGGKIFL